MPATMPQGTKVSSWPSALRVGFDHPRKIQCRVAGRDTGQAERAQAGGGRRGGGLLVRAPRGGRIDDQHRPALGAIGHRYLVHSRGRVAIARVRRDAEQIERGPPSRERICRSCCPRRPQKSAH